MRLDRNLSGSSGKYAIVNRRKVMAKSQGEIAELQEHMLALEKAGVLEYGDEAENEFFVIKLRDIHAPPALQAYAMSACLKDSEYAMDIVGLANKAITLPNRKHPD